MNARPFGQLRRELGLFHRQLQDVYKRLPWSHRLLNGLSMAIQALAAASLGYGLGRLLHTQQAFWGALTAIAVTQQSYLDTRKLSVDQVVGASIGAALAMIGAYLGATTVTIVMLVPHDGPFWTVALTRLGEVTLGIASALVVTSIAHKLEKRLLGDRE